MASDDLFPLDPVALTQALVRCPSVTPAEAGALTVLADALAPYGFAAERCDRDGTPNLWLSRGDGGGAPVLGFNGHTDVVPVGDRATWTGDPFSGEIRDGRLHGRGSVDMKSGVAAWAAAAAAYVAAGGNGALALMITGDEEGTSTDGTIAILDWMDATGRRVDACVVGEPTCPETFGDMIKIGRRGSMTGHVTARGRQGHSAYPHRALNPLPALVAFCDGLARWEIDAGTDDFQPTTLALTTLDVGNPVNNVIPAEGRATFNIRFNDAWTSADLIRLIEERAAALAAETGVELALRFQVSGESFLTPPGPLSTLVSGAVERVTGQRPALSTSGGTSDARFVKRHCPVVEFGLVGRGMHAVDESADLGEIAALAEVYLEIIRSYFAQG